jgi:hypothetical protein
VRCLSLSGHLRVARKQIQGYRKFSQFGVRATHQRPLPSRRFLRCRCGNCAPYRCRKVPTLRRAREIASRHAVPLRRLQEGV